MDFYYNDMSAPCRAVMLTAAAVKAKLNKKSLDIGGGETKTPEFMAINPQHCVPTLVDGDLKLWESRAICSYLASKCCDSDCLYPNDPKKRAMVDKLLYFDIGTLYSRFAQFVYPVMFDGAKIDISKLDAVQEALGWLDGFLSGHDYAAGCKITIADHCLVATVSTMVEAGVKICKHKNISCWLQRCKKNMPGYDCANDKGAKIFGGFAKSKLGSY